ncbi:hypothetical protein DPEC_G00227020 [Dallia pectoralis]|uniref:Uncharacterized protein n=1 Tax=Dallia pectoralis TaxID=75939 RepID=A0ACC2G0R7_DALPE|nr:hypothetical protein DPEC_G00227020 [Dallia pectoralis]
MYSSSGCGETTEPGNHFKQPSALCGSPKQSSPPSPSSTLQSPGPHGAAGLESVCPSVIVMLWKNKPPLTASILTRASWPAVGTNGCFLRGENPCGPPAVVPALGAARRDKSPSHRWRDTPGLRRAAVFPCLPNANAIIAVAMEIECVKRQAVAAVFGHACAARPRRERHGKRTPHAPTAIPAVSHGQQPSAGINPPHWSALTYRSVTHSR